VSRERKLAKIKLVSRRFGAIDAIVSNVSRKGARIRTDSEMMVHDLVFFRFRENDPVHAKVCWKEGQFCGLQFDDEFDTGHIVLNQNYLPEGVYRENARYSAFDRFKAIEAEQRPVRNWKIAAV